MHACLKAKPDAKFGRWTVTSEFHRRGKHIFVDCVCECGTERRISVHHLIIGRSRSCGCLRREVSREVHWKHGGTVGGYKHEYRVWAHMISRCSNRNLRAFKDYGGRGISVCARWRSSFASFHNDMGDRPTPSHTLDRINNNGNYEPSNCRWATIREQNNNRRDNRVIRLNGVRLTVAQWSEHVDLKAGTIYARLARGWSSRKALTCPLGA